MEFVYMYTNLLLLRSLGADAVVSYRLQVSHVSTVSEEYKTIAYIYGTIQ